MTDGYVGFDNPKPTLESPQLYDVTRGFTKQFRAFRLMARPYFDSHWKPRLMFGVMILLTLLNSAVRVVFSFLARDFWTALSEERQDDFYRIIKQFVLAMAVLAPINVFYRYQKQMLAIGWREWMTKEVLNLYFSNQVYYGLERSAGHASGVNERSSGSPPLPTVDNPDQRITEDVRSFTESSLTVFLTVLMSVVDLVCFSAILYTVMPMLFLAIVGFAVFGSLMTMLIGKVLVQLNFEKLQNEASLRYSLVRTRENAEAIAFLRGEEAESQIVRMCLKRVIVNMHALNAAVRNLEFFTTYYDYLTWILPILVVAPQYFAGVIELGVIQQAVAAFSHVLDDLSILVTQWESLSEFGAGIDRLYTFLTVARHLQNQNGSTDQPLLGGERVDKLPVHYQAGAHQGVQLRQVNNRQMALSVQNLALTTPQRVLFEGLNVSVKWGEHLLITGPSGTGKSSLARAIAGLEHAGSGSIQRPPDFCVYFLPQKPYCSTGSLRDQLLYPRINHNEEKSSEHLEPIVSDSDLLGVLRAVDLAEISLVGAGDPLKGLDENRDWSNTLSLGEQQRLAFGRLLVNKPQLVVLDESTSALDVDSERRMYRLLGAQGITYISVGHRESLEEFHHHKLAIVGGASNHKVDSIQNVSLTN